MKRVNRKGDSTQSCGAPVFKMRGLERVVDFDILRPIKKKVENPVIDGRMYIQQGKFTEQLIGDDGVEC